MVLTDSFERVAWERFAAAAIAGAQGEGENEKEDAAIAADFADELLEQWRARVKSSAKE
jgi:hypothetical protein